MKPRYVTLLIVTATALVALTACQPGAGTGSGGGGTAACSPLPASIDVATTLPAGCYAPAGDVDVNAALTLSPGVRVVFQKDRVMNVNVPGGSLYAVGNASSGGAITFEGAQDTQGFWQGINILSVSTKNDLEYVDVRDAGSVSGAPGNGAAVWVASSVPFTMKHTTVEMSLTDGLDVDASTPYTFLQLQANSYRNDQGYPVSVPADAVGALDPASSYSSNGKPQVEVFGGDVDVAQTWPMLSLPYFLSLDTSVKAALTLAAGVTVQMDTDTSFDVGIGNPGTLTALGSATAGVAIERAPTSGPWAHINFESNGSANQLRYITVSGGGDTGYGETAELYSQNGGSVTIDHGTFSDSLAKAICWDGPSDQPTTSAMTYTNVDTTPAQYCLP